MTEISSDLIWWISVVDLPALAGLLWMIWRVRSENDRAIDDLHINLERRCDQLRDALYGFKLEAAKTYDSQKDMRSLENRIVEHLLRIESKLDATALKTEGLKAQAATKRLKD